MQEPSWCFVVNTMYCCPAARARSTKVFGSNFAGLKRLGNSRYSASLMPVGVGVIMGQDASTLPSEYGPQWMNIPNFASRYHRVRSLAKLGLNPRPGMNGSADPASVSPRNSRRESEQALTRAAMLSRHRLAQNRSVPLSLDSHMKSSLLPRRATRGRQRNFHLTPSHNSIIWHAYHITRQPAF